MPVTQTGVDIAIPVEANAAAALRDASVRAMAGRLVSRMLQPASLAGLFHTMDAVSTEAAKRGLTEDILNAELAADNAENRARVQSALGSHRLTAPMAAVVPDQGVSLAPIIR